MVKCRKHNDSDIKPCVRAKQVIFLCCYVIHIDFEIVKEYLLLSLLMNYVRQVVMYRVFQRSVDKQWNHYF